MTKNYTIFFERAFEGVVVPRLEELATKDDLEGVKETIDKIERTVDRIEDRMDRYSVKYILLSNPHELPSRI